MAITLSKATCTVECKVLLSHPRGSQPRGEGGGGREWSCRYLRDGEASGTLDDSWSLRVER